jgi:hypothetical protein
MSGWNKRTGFYELTFSQSQRWFRRKDIPNDCKILEGKEFLDFISCLVEHNGLRVVSKHNAWLEIECHSAGEIWEALSGLPSNPELIAIHDRTRPKS